MEPRGPAAGGLGGVAKTVLKRSLIDFGNHYLDATQFINYLIYSITIKNHRARQLTRGPGRPF